MTKPKTLEQLKKELALKQSAFNAHVDAEEKLRTGLRELSKQIHEMETLPLEQKFIEFAKIIEDLASPLGGDSAPSNEYLAAARLVHSVLSDRLQWISSGCANWTSSDDSCYNG